MRLRLWLAVAMFIAVIGVAAPQQAAAGGWEHRRSDRTITHRVYRPHYKHVYIEHDPYGYHPGHFRYYPYYNSGYWRPLREMRHRHSHRHRLEFPNYYSSWGYPTRKKSYKKRYRKHSDKRRSSHRGRATPHK